MSSSAIAVLVALSQLGNPALASGHGTSAPARVSDDARAIDDAAALASTRAPETAGANDRKPAGLSQEGPPSSPSATKAKVASPQAAVGPLPGPSGPALAPAPRCLAIAGPCRQLTTTGLGFISIGTLAAITGAAFLGVPDRVDPDAPAYLRSYDPPGVALVGMGVGVLLTGVLMIIAGRRAHRFGTAPVGPSSASPDKLLEPPPRVGLAR